MFDDIASSMTSQQHSGNIKKRAPHDIVKLQAASDACYDSGQVKISSSSNLKQK